jgi:hypothetical protein
MLTVFILVLPIENTPGRRRDWHLQVCLRAFTAEDAPGYVPRSQHKEK